MPIRRPNDKHKVSKANRLRNRLCDQRLTDVQSTQPQCKYTLRTKRSISDRNPELALKISQMRLGIAPIVHVTSGVAAPDFPRTMLSLFTLTEPQLDALALYYSQIHNDGLKFKYPQTMDWSKPFLDNDPELPEDCKLTEIERLKVKMRMFARFIGMRGAETPGWEYERQIEILGKKVERVVKQEEEDALRMKGFRGLTRY